MPPEEGRRSKVPLSYEILFVPHGEGGRKRSFRFSRIRLWVGAGAAAIGLVVVVLSLLMYTPIAMYIPIKNPDIEERYSQQVLETQQRLNHLAQDVLVLRDYNQQLRKALGEVIPGDTADRRDRNRGQREAREPEVLVSDSGDMNEPTMPPVVMNGDGGFDLTEGSYTEMVFSRTVFPLLPPTQGFLTQGFDPDRGHYGLDYATKRGTSVYAAAGGYVLFSGWTYEDGNMMILSHSGGYVTVYKHNQLLFKRNHSTARRGELIALSGSTGKSSSGPHLHFEVWKDGEPQNPADFLLSESGLAMNGGR
jgi:murein DD-endopeptidase MepM/ murein hydrolase activator NlpD